VGVISIVASRPQSEHLPFNTIVDFLGLDSNIFPNISIIGEHILPLLVLSEKKNIYSFGILGFLLKSPLLLSLPDQRLGYVSCRF
jgi:hypothetical protein